MQAQVHSLELLSHSLLISLGLLRRLHLRLNLIGTRRSILPHALHFGHVQSETSPLCHVIVAVELLLIQVPPVVAWYEGYPGCGDDELEASQEGACVRGARRGRRRIFF